MASRFVQKLISLIDLLTKKKIKSFNLIKTRDRNKLILRFVSCAPSLKRDAITERSLARQEKIPN